MSSWASITKRNIPGSATAPAATVHPTAPTVQRHRHSQSNIASTASTVVDPVLSMHRATYDNSVSKIAREDEANLKPISWVVQRPGGITSCSPFMIYEARNTLEWDEYQKNREYSDDLFKERMNAWREKNNWYLPPMKQTVSEAEKALGFYTKPDDFGHGTVVVAYITPHGTRKDLSYGESISHNGLSDLLWSMIHSRSEELIKCETVREFDALFEQVVQLEMPGWLQIGGGVYRSTMSRKVLWLFSQHANVFPGRRRHGTPRWTNSAFSIPCERDSKYTANMVFQNVPKGGRDDAGICVVAKLKEHGDDAKIRWLLNAKQMREMERVELIPESNPFNHYNDYDSDYDW